MTGAESRLPPVRREFRGLWVATVANTDWPSRPGLPAREQQRELLAIMDRAAALRMNAIILQVRPACDAIYASGHEPWSEYLSGRMGQPPTPYYDPLAFAVAAAHARGLELHAWINPFRSRHASGRSPPAANHVSRQKSGLVRRYGNQLWLDPGEPAAQDHVLTVIRDIIRRYDVDGMHLDDYFYPYPEKDAGGVRLDFPDDAPWSRYGRPTGLARDEWRRANIDAFVSRVYEQIKGERPWVKVGISPFGIWRPGHPQPIRGLDPYRELYADSRKWLVQGWVDYFSPQLYWPISAPAQSYPALLGWWLQQNPHGRHVWPGNNASKVGASVYAAGPAFEKLPAERASSVPGQDMHGSFATEPAPVVAGTQARSGWPAAEIAEQIRITRSSRGAMGNILFSAKALMSDRGGLATLLGRSVYAAPALPPAFPWLDQRPPSAPKLSGRTDSGSILRLDWSSADAERPALWVVRARYGDKWICTVLPGWRGSCRLPARGGAQGPGLAAVSAVDRCGNLGRPSIVSLR